MTQNDKKHAGVGEAVAIAAVAHREQRDKAGAPYILHPLRLMMRMETETEMIVAVLHDVVEDSEDWTFDRLLQEGFSRDVIDALDSVTRREDETYEEFVERAALNPVGIRVKLADLEDNMNVLRFAALGETDHARIDRYHKAWRYLKGLS